MKSKKLMKPSRALGVLSIAVTAAMCSSAAVAATPGWYLGGNLGLSRAEIDKDKIRRGLEGEGFSVSSFSDDHRDLGYKLFGGYQFNRYLALEGGYFDLGKFDFEATTAPPGSLKGNIDITGFNLDLVGAFPLSSRWSVFGRGGVTQEEAKDRFSGTGAVDVTDSRRKKSATNYKFGAGLEYAVTDAIGLRAEAERYRINDAVGNEGDVDLYSLGVVYRFGQTREAPAASTQPVPASAPVVAAPPPPPPPVLAAPAPAPRRVTFSADSLFDFDEAIVKPEGRRELDALATDLKDARYGVVTVTGHTDRMGPEAYNLALSERRAVAVKAYLVSAGIPAARIVTRGVDGSEPVTGPDDCKATLPRARRIACLQPDRRVEVEVAGTKEGP